MRQQPSMYSLAASCHSEGINAHCTATGRTWTVLSQIDTQPHLVLSGAADLACSQRVAEAGCCVELSFTLVQVKKTLRMYIDNYDYHHETIAKGDDVTGSSMFHCWLHQVSTCTATCLPHHGCFSSSGMDCCASLRAMAGTSVSLCCF